MNTRKTDHFDKEKHLNQTFVFGFQMLISCKCQEQDFGVFSIVPPASFHSNNLLWLSHRKVDMLLGGTWRHGVHGMIIPSRDTANI